MAAGVPVVASMVGGLADLVVGDATGILVALGDVIALREALGLLLSDPALRQRLGEAGRKRAMAYSASTVVRAWEKVFREVLEGHKSPDSPGPMQSVGGR
jgi:glycosyltransferase involved in cell wall biosynthesis